MSSLQCLKRVHLEVNHKELIHFSRATEAAFAVGHTVGDIAIELYAGSGGSYIDYNGGSFSAALAQTRKLMNSMVRAPIFEATLQHEGVLVREDILLPCVDQGRDSWRIVEVKTSTCLKQEYVQDCAVQAIDARLVDLHPVALANYYHPDMLGSWSIKSLLPAIAPDMDYALLEGIQEGTAASAAYLEAIGPETSAERREEIRRDLLRYCKHDTEAMVRLVGFFGGMQEPLAL